VWYIFIPGEKRNLGIPSLCQKFNSIVFLRATNPNMTHVMRIIGILVASEFERMK
jgi:hypothetical protein